MVDFERRERASWPPSPDTLFSALVAAAASLGNACHPALYWLERQGNPNIEADASPPMVEAVRVYCPVADRPIWDAGSRQARFSQLGWLAEARIMVLECYWIARRLKHCRASRAK